MYHRSLAESYGAEEVGCKSCCTNVTPITTIIWAETEYHGQHVEFTYYGYKCPTCGTPIIEGVAKQNYLRVLNYYKRKIRESEK